MAHMSDVMSFDEMERHLRQRVSRFRDHPEWEDAVQEGRISIWKDLQEGTKDHPHMVFRAIRVARALLFNPTAHPTGHVAIGASAGTRKTSRGEATREKIRNYLQDYRRLHDSEPTAYRIGKDLGIDRSTVSAQLRKMRSGETGWHHPGLPLMADGRVDLKAIAHVELKFSDGEDREGGINEPVEPSFEDSYIGSAVTVQALNQLDDVLKEAIYLFFWQEHTLESYAKLKGCSQSKAWNRKTYALDTLRGWYTDTPIEDYWPV